MALGAQRAQIPRLVGRQGLRVIAAGLLIGLLVAFAVGQLIQDFLVGIGPMDAVTYITISMMLGRCHGRMLCTSSTRNQNRSHAGVAKWK
jgi:ABC-type lipoprotein release transport system permease subunit